ncbi:MAG: SDR family oxidoreductase, partial [Leptospiraceae bacterium]|nr:SDR family oxidoreductase [Leptospiraceae bacterium]
MKSLSILMTGAAGGVGQTLARDLIKLGHRLLLTDQNKSELKRIYATELRDHSQVSAEKLDITSHSAWQKLIASWAGRQGSLDIVLNIAGLLRPGYSFNVSTREIDAHIDVNAKGTIYGIASASAFMKEQGHGHIISIASLAGVAPIPGISLYSASKFAVRGYSLAVAQELKNYNVQVTVLCPDAIRTPMLDLQKDYEEAALTFSGSRYLSPTDVSRTLQKIINAGQKGKAPVEVTLP